MQSIKMECAGGINWPSVKTIGYRLWPLNGFPVSFQMSSPLRTQNYNTTNQFVKGYIPSCGSGRIGVYEKPFLGYSMSLAGSWMRGNYAQYSEVRS